MSGVPRPASLSSPAAGGNLFPGLGRSNPPPKQGLPRSFPPAPVEAPAPPRVPVEEISSSLLLPDDSGSLEELSGSVLIEDAPDGQGPPIVTALGPQAGLTGASSRPAPAAPAEPHEQAHRALLGMPQLPTSTPPPDLSAAARRELPDYGDQASHSAEGSGEGQPDVPASDEAAHADTRIVRVVELPAGQAHPDAHPDTNDPDLPRLPTGGLGAALGLARERAKSLFDHVRGTLLASAEDRPGGRPQWAIPAVTLAGLFVGVAVAGLIFSMTGKRKSGGEDDPAHASAASASASARSMPSAPSAAAAPAPATAPAAPPASVSACTVTATPQIVAPAALVPAGVEVRAFGDAIAVGFAPSEREGRALRVDPVTLAASGGVTQHATEVVRRVRPIVTLRDTLGLAIDAERRRDRVHGRRTLPIDPPLQVGAFGDDLVWTRPGGGPAGKLWPLSGSSDIDALRAASEGAPGDTTTAIVFRRGSEVSVGVATGYRALAPRGDLSRVAGLGPSVGSPAVAVNDGTVVAAWSDRASADAPWHIRMVHMKAGEPASEPVTFRPPPGGPGAHVMAPSLAPVPGGRFLLVWTEGPMSQQRVRAVTLTAAGEPMGKALEISNEAVNSGQGQAAVTASAGAKGIVAFLQATDGGFEIVATGIGCES
jgi:hypothetical protein